jgi:hypothetical protein
MIRVSQHQPNGALFDLVDIVRDLSTVEEIEMWHYDIEWALWGMGANLPEEDKGPATLSHEQFSAKFRDLYQTIDGTYTALAGGSPVARFEAVDSSYWEIEASPSVEALFAEKYACMVSNNSLQADRER